MHKFPGYISILRLIFASMSCSIVLTHHTIGAEFKIDAEFPGGNIKIDRVEGNAVFLRQDLRDTNRDWFYWNFRVLGAEGRRLSFTFASDKFSARGPAISTDRGITWNWLGGEIVKDRTFAYTFDADDNDVRFSMGMPYTDANLNFFLREHAANTAIRSQTLCQSEKGRKVELLQFGKLNGEPRLRAFITARHHACEMMASYALEGIIQSVLAEDETGKWFRDNVEFRAVPFMDKDGVEGGDQGKSRLPHDHCRDYMGEPIYASVAAVKKMLPEWSGDKLEFTLDIHCPGLRGRGHEEIFFVGGPDSENWSRVTRFSKLLEELSTKSSLAFHERNNIPFGKSWNTTINGVDRNFATWACTASGVKIGTVLELPYATVEGQEVNAQSARSFGRSLATAIHTYLKDEGE